MLRPLPCNTATATRALCPSLLVPQWTVTVTVTMMVTGVARFSLSKRAPTIMARKIWETPEWKALADHKAAVIDATHLRDLLQVRAPGPHARTHTRTWA